MSFNELKIWFSKRFGQWWLSAGIFTCLPILYNWIWSQKPASNLTCLNPKPIRCCYPLETRLEEIELMQPFIFGWVCPSTTLYLVYVIRTSFCQSLSNFTYTLLMIRGGSLFLGHGQLWNSVSLWNLLVRYKMYIQTAAFAQSPPN